MKLILPRQPLADAAKVFLAMGCFGAMAYFAFAAFTRDQASHSALPADADALQEPALAPLHAPTAEERQTDQAIAALIDKLETVIARGQSGSQPEENATALLGRIMTLEASASPYGLNLVIGMSKRFAARAHNAATVGSADEARRLEEFSRLQQGVRTLRESEAPSGSAPQLLPESAPTSPSTPDQPPPKTEEFQLAPQSKDSNVFDEFGKPTAKLVQAEAGIACPPRDAFENAQAWVHERFKCERHPTPIEPWIEWAEYCPSGPLGYFVLKVKTGQQKVYLFENIPPAVWEGFKAAPSAGKFYHSEIKGKRHWFRLASQLKPSTCHR